MGKEIVRVLGIDPATTKPLGMALVSMVDDVYVVEHSGLFPYVCVRDFLIKTKPDMVVIEDQYMFKNFNTSKKLIQCVGRIMGLCGTMRIPHTVMNVAHWKSYMKAQHGTHVDRCKQIFNNIYQDDIASAILIATCYLDEICKT